MNKTKNGFFNEKCMTQGNESNDCIISFLHNWAYMWRRYKTAICSYMHNTLDVVQCCVVIPAKLPDYRLPDHLLFGYPFLSSYPYANCHGLTAPVSWKR